jgi:hypothetical protein
MPFRREFLETAKPQLIADLRLYPTAEGGKALQVQPGFGCVCTMTKAPPLAGYDGKLLLNEPIQPGEIRRVGFVFLSGEETAARFRQAGVFYLWEGKFIGEARVLQQTK